MADDAAKGSFWTTLPGIITASAGLLTAVAGLVGALFGAGVIGHKSADVPRPAIEARVPATGGGGFTASAADEREPAAPRQARSRPQPQHEPGGAASDQLTAGVPDVGQPRIAGTSRGSVTLDVDYSAPGAKGPIRLLLLLRSGQERGHPIAKCATTPYAALSGTANCEARLETPRQRHASIVRIVLLDGDRQLLVREMPLEVTFP